MMTNFMGDDISLGKIARGAEAVFELSVEMEIDVNFLIGRTIKRPHSRQTHTAGGAYPPAKQYELGIAVALAILRKSIPPNIFGCTKDCGHETVQVILGRPLRVLNLRATVSARDRQICGV